MLNVIFVEWICELVETGESWSGGMKFLLYVIRFLCETLFVDDR